MNNAFLTQEERLLALTEILAASGKVTLEQICRQFSLSRDAARRDLDCLCQDPRAIRTRDGATLNTSEPVTKPYLQRASFSSQKQQLAKCAVELLQPGETLYVDAGTTLSLLADQLAQRNLPADVVSHALDIQWVLSLAPHIRLHPLGGILDPLQRASFGPATQEQLQHYHFSTALLGVCALDGTGMSSSHPQEARLKALAIQQADRVLALTTADKIGHQHRYPIAPLSQIDILILDRAPTDDLREQFDRAEIQLIVTGESHD